MQQEVEISDQKVGADADVAPLRHLGLSAEEWEALRHQGFVEREIRGRGRVVYKLRFRCAGRQRVRYLGTDPAAAERVRQALVRLQATTRLDRTLGRLVRTARRTLGRTKARLEPGLRDAGYHYHGLAIRQCQGLPDAPAIEPKPQNQGGATDHGGAQRRE